MINFNFDANVWVMYYAIYTHDTSCAKLSINARYLNTHCDSKINMNVGTFGKIYLNSFVRYKGRYITMVVSPSPFMLASHVNLVWFDLWKG